MHPLLIPALTGLVAGVITYLSTGKKGASVNAAIDKVQEFIPDPVLNAKIDAAQALREKAREARENKQPAEEKPDVDPEKTD